MPETTHEVRNFLKVLDMEKDLDFKQVERERTEIIRKLVEKMDKREIAGLINHHFDAIEDVKRELRYVAVVG